MEKEFIKETLENILSALKSGEIEKHDWYSGLYPDEFSEHIGDDKYKSSVAHATEDGEETTEERYSVENVLAIEAIQYPELHGLMEQVVLAITEFGETGRFKQIWENEEEQAGGCLARELACYDKSYIPLYMRYIATNDLDHEVHQSDDIISICDKWNSSKETFPLMIYRAEFGQETEIYEGLAEGICKAKEEADGYLAEAIKYFEENWSFTEDDEDDIEQIQHFFAPVFAGLFDLDDEQMEQFATTFVNMMAEEETPAIADLLENIE